MLIGKAGHINADSGLGFWEKGYQLLQELFDAAVDTHDQKQR